MRVPLSWLREFVDFDLLPEGLAERLTMLGMEVAGIERIGADWSSVVVGELLDVQPHPGSARLSLTRVRTSDGQPELSIVCGAINIEPGQRVPVALPGARLPGDRRIEVTRIAGEESQGMLCSGAELGLTADADGILILAPGADLGTPLADLLGDVVLDVDVKPNRGDALSIVGLAREVAAATGTKPHQPVVAVTESGDDTADHVTVEVRDVMRCPRFVARYLDGLKVGPSPTATQVRLMAAGVRPVSNVVDASNHVMLELGKPTHTFDAARVRDGRLIVRGATAGEHLETLDHVGRSLDEGTLLIADADGPLAMAGLIGGAASEVSQGTTTVIIESAIFDALTIRRTGQRYGLRSEASLRFEKGQETRLARVAADDVARLIAHWAGARVARGVIDTDPQDPPQARLAFRPRRVSQWLGVDLAGAEMAELLGREGIATAAATTKDTIQLISGERPVPLDEKAAADALVALIPSHRRDLAVEADMAEEVARMYGYDAFPKRLPDTLMPRYLDDPQRGQDDVRDLLSGRGLDEVVTVGLIAPADHERLGKDGSRTTIQAANPVSADHSELRRSMLPGLVRCLVDNERQRRDDVAVFELGATHGWLDGRPDERHELAILLAGAVAPPAVEGPSRHWDVADAKGLVEWLVERVGQGRIRFEPATALEAVEHPGRTALIAVELSSGQRMELGRVGELDPRYLVSYGARAERAIFALVDLPGLARLAPTRRRLPVLDKTPGADRDISVVVDASRPANEVAALIHAAGGPRLRSVRLFDRWEGPPLAGGEVSLGYHLRFEPGDQPLKDGDPEAATADIVTALRDRLGARIRG